MKGMLGSFTKNLKTYHVKVVSDIYVVDGKPYLVILDDRSDEMFINCPLEEFTPFSKGISLGYCKVIDVKKGI